MLHDDAKREKVLEGLKEKRIKSPKDNDAFFDSLDAAERLLLTNIHFGIYKVSDEDKELLSM